jgi:hypothetical protein
VPLNDGQTYFFGFAMQDSSGIELFIGGAHGIITIVRECLSLTRSEAARGGRSDAANSSPRRGPHGRAARRRSRSTIARKRDR